MTDTFWNNTVRVIYASSAKSPFRFNGNIEFDGVCAHIKVFFKRPAQENLWEKPRDGVPRLCRKWKKSRKFSVLKLWKLLPVAFWAFPLLI
jgi:hypothetical protein